MQLIFKAGEDILAAFQKVNMEIRPRKTHKIRRHEDIKLMNVGLQRESKYCTAEQRDGGREKMKNKEDRVKGDKRQSKQWRKLKVEKKNNVEKKKELRNNS